MSKAILLLGSNIENRIEFINNAINHLKRKVGNITSFSSVYETEPWGFINSKSFLNQVLIIETKLTPHQLLAELIKIERELGRIRNEIQYSSRTIDIDILFFENEIIEDETLVIPHPRLHLRLFTLIPLLEIAPGLKHPLFDKDILTLVKECKDNAKVKQYLLTSEI